MTTMKAMTYYGENDIRFEDRPVPTIIDPTDAIIRMTKTTICGTDLASGRARTLRLRRLLATRQAIGMGESLVMKVLALSRK
ncbi:Uncharacterised protein [Moraxella ovis]|uniref:Formaldehyde dismutase n=1 Tax=Moraxella ovis TaxID=29433 RepID=A0A378PLI7_9GAMM|nr:hypothetical protein [Moraxella ovis]STY87298.1 Uncharacterised protein [Moraxella ovis]